MHRQAGGPESDPGPRKICKPKLADRTAKLPRQHQFRIASNPSHCVAVLDARISFEVAANVSRCSLLTAGAAVGVSTSLKDAVNVGRAAIALPVP